MGVVPKKHKGTVRQAETRQIHGLPCRLVFGSDVGRELLLCSEGWFFTKYLTF